MSQLLEKCKLVNYIYEPVQSIYNSSDEVFIYLKNHLWKIVKDKEDIFTANNPADVIDFLNEENYDLSIFEAIINTNLLSRAALAQITLNEALQFFSQDDINNAVDAWNNFAHALQTDLFKQIENKKRNFSLIDKGE